MTNEQWAAFSEQLRQRERRKQGKGLDRRISGAAVAVLFLGAVAAAVIAFDAFAVSVLLRP